MAKPKKTQKKLMKNRTATAGVAGKQPKRWIAALLLSIFLGALGVDRFYLGYIGTGILKLLITLVTFGIGGWIWWLIDLILIATKYDFARVRWVD